MGPSLALFDVGVAALKASGNPKDKTLVANAMKTLSVVTPVGHLHWGKGPVPNVVQTPIPGGQWLKAQGRPVQAAVGLLRAHRRPRTSRSRPSSSRTTRRLGSSWGRNRHRSLPPSGIRRRFGALVVLDGVDFAVGAGDAVGIVGPNGAGKTTLLNVLSGALRPSAGTVLFRGEDVTRAGVARRCRLGHRRGRTRCRGRSAT